MKALTFEIDPARWVLCKMLGRLTPVVYWSALSGLRLCEIPEPQLPGPGWVKLRTLLGGICGTDLGLVLQRMHPATILRAFSSFPAVLGHENVAVIHETDGLARGWSEGTRVVVEPSLSCLPRGTDRPCPSCEKGYPSICESFRGGKSLAAGTMIGMNNWTSGSWAPVFVAHHSQLHAVPDEIPDEQAVLIDPIACGLHGVLRHRPEPSDSVLILGGGIIALAVLMAIRALGFTNRITCVVRHRFQQHSAADRGADQTVRLARNATTAERLARIADAIGAEHVRARFKNGVLQGGADVVYDCTGTGQGLADAMRCCRPRGTVVALGTAQFTWTDTTPLWFHELNIVGVHGRQLEDWQGKRIHTYDLVIDLMRSGKLRLDGLLTHIFDLREYRRAFSTLVRRTKSGVVKAAFRHG